MTAVHDASRPGTASAGTRSSAPAAALARRPACGCQAPPSSGAAARLPSRRPRGETESGHEDLELGACVRVRGAGGRAEGRRGPRALNGGAAPSFPRPRGRAAAPAPHRAGPCGGSRALPGRKWEIRRARSEEGAGSGGGSRAAVPARRLARQAGAGRGHRLLAALRGGLGPGPAVRQRSHRCGVCSVFGCFLRARTPCGDLSHLLPLSAGNTIPTGLWWRWPGCVIA